MQRDHLTGIILSLAIVFSFSAFLEASDSSTVTHGANQSITAHSTCRRVTNNSTTGLSVYVPTVSSAEWASFYTNPPSGVVANACGTNNVTFASPVTYAPGISSQGVELGDFNGDGYLDVAVPNFGAGGSATTISVFLNRGASAPGTLHPRVNYSIGTGSRDVAIGDINNDGRQDMVTSNWTSGSVSVLTGIGNGTFNTRVNYASASNAVALGDLNADGHLDIANVNGPFTILINRAAVAPGTFAPAVSYPTSAATMDVAVADFNADGYLDLVGADGYRHSTVSILLNRGVAAPGTFNARTAYSVGSYPMGVAAADFDSNGSPDIVVANNSSNSISFLRNNGNGTFATSVNFAVGAGPWRVKAGDVSGDGIPDVVVSNFSGNSISVLVASTTGAAMFNSPRNFSVAGGPMDVSIGDVNNDGKNDIVVANLLAAVMSVLINTSVW